MLQIFGCLKIISCGPELLRMHISGLECGLQSLPTEVSVSVRCRSYDIHLNDTVISVLYNTVQHTPPHTKDGSCTRPIHFLVSKELSNLFHLLYLRQIEKCSIKEN